MLQIWVSQKNILGASRNRLISPVEGGIVQAGMQRLMVKENEIHPAVVPRWTRRPMASCSVSEIVWLGGLRKELPSCTQHWWDRTSNTEFSFELLTVRGILVAQICAEKSSEASKGIRTWVVRRSWGNWGWRRGGWGETSLLSTVTWKQVPMGRALVSFLSWWVTGWGNSHKWH